MDIFFSIAILIMSVVIHEVSHGFAAQALGDPTANYAGRLTLNPLKHIDIVGSIIVPTILFLIPPHMVFGWAKPVPVNPYNLRNGKVGEGLVAAAGPASNLFIATVFGLVLRFAGPAGLLSASFLSISVTVVFINILLAVFNLMPIPPLDGSKILFAFLPNSALGIQNWFEKYQTLIFLFFVFFLWQFVNPLILVLFRVITGFSLGS